MTVQVEFTNVLHVKKINTFKNRNTGLFLIIVPQLYQIILKTSETEIMKSIFIYKWHLNTSVASVCV